MRKVKELRGNTVKKTAYLRTVGAKIRILGQS